MMLIGLSGIWILLTNSAHQENREFRVQLQKQIAAGTESQIHSIGKVARDYALWNEFDEKINRPRPDMPWLRANLTASIYENLNVDVALLIDLQQHKILYGIKNGKILNYPYQALTLPDNIWPWLQKAMQQPLRESALTALVSRETEDGRSQSLLYLLAAHPIAAETTNTPSKHNAKILLFARLVDRDLLQQLSRSYNIQQPVVRFAPEDQPTKMSQPIFGLDHQPIAYLTWQITPPGDQLLQLAAPGAITLGTLLLFLGLLLGQQAKRLQHGQESTLRRLEKQGRLLRSIATSSEKQGKSLQDLQNLCQQLSETLVTDRVGIWRHDQDSQKLRCIVGTDTQGKTELQGVEVEASHLYLQELEQQRYVAVDEIDAVNNTESFSLYAARNQLHSILDVTVRVGSEVRAIISAECRHRRSWTQDEINFFCSAADGIALLTEANARQAAESELTHLFYYDRITGLPNYQRLRIHLDTLTSARNARPGACVLMDLSNLSSVIDAYNLTFGNQLLSHIARRIESLTRSGEIAASAGEARFALWFEGETEVELTKRLNHLQQALLQPLILDGTTIHPRFQMGVSLFPGDGHNADTLLAHARSALSHAHKLSRQSWVRFNRGMSQTQSEQHRLQMDLREACERGQLHLHYQPIIKLSNNRVIGAEALLRWAHPEKGAIAPDVFIPLAEADDALINSIGAWVLDQACAEIATWRRDFSSSLTMAINVSVKQMETEGFHRVVSATLARYGLPPQAIELEVTESIALSGTTELEVNLNALQQQNIRLAIDDFGTGYASFSYLRRFPVARLKVDRQFFDQVPGNLQRSNLVKTIVSMGHTLGAQVIGEGVEHIEQVEFLKQIGGDYAQGYYFSRPLTPQDMASFLQYSPYAPLVTIKS